MNNEESIETNDGLTAEEDDGHSKQMIVGVIKLILPS